jgi:hypothetical protein
LPTGDIGAEGEEEEGLLPPLLPAAAPEKSDEDHEPIEDVFVLLLPTTLKLPPLAPPPDCDTGEGGE